jgi:hypothetical protein
MRKRERNGGGGKGEEEMEKKEGAAKWDRYLAAGVECEREELKRNKEEGEERRWRSRAEGGGQMKREQRTSSTITRMLGNRVGILLVTPSFARKRTHVARGHYITVGARDFFFVNNIRLVPRDELDIGESARACDGTFNSGISVEANSAAFVEVGRNERIVDRTHVRPPDPDGMLSDRTSDFRSSAARGGGEGIKHGRLIGGGPGARGPGDDRAILL